ADIRKSGQSLCMIGRKGRLLALVVIVAAIAFVAFIRVSPWVAQDACLDGGGAWHGGKCVH
ncbi:MAG: hypothetical protein ABIO80_03975, partial [Sphingomicrobium sp.]